MVCDIRLGTSGFHYKHWKGPFYPPKIPVRVLSSQFACFGGVILSVPVFRRSISLTTGHYLPHTIPLRNSFKGYFVPRHSIPSFHKVRIIERRSV